MAGKENRCWPGYEPVPGKPEHSQGSCKPKAESKSSPSEKGFRAKRKKELDQWQADHPGKKRQSAQHLSAPGAKKKATKKAAAKKTAPKKKTAAKRTSATRKGSAPRKRAAGSTARKTTRASS